MFANAIALRQVHCSAVVKFIIWLIICQESTINTLPAGEVYVSEWRVRKRWSDAEVVSYAP